MADNLPPLDEKKRYVDKLDFESLVFRQVDRLNDISIRYGKGEAYIVGVDQLATLCRAYGDDALNAKIDSIDEEFSKKVKNTTKINILKTNTAEMKFSAVMNFLARSGLSGRKKTTGRF